MKNSKVIIVVDDNIRKKTLKSFFATVQTGIKTDFVTSQKASAQTADYSGVQACAIDFCTENKNLLRAAFKIRETAPDIDIVVIVPSSEFLIPAEVIELGLGPAVYTEDDSFETVLAQTLTALSNEEGQNEFSSKATRADMKVRHQELREITDTLARQSLHLTRLSKELAAEKKKVETVFDGMTDSVVFFDVEGKYEISNSRAKRLFPVLTDLPAPDLFEFTDMLDSLPKEKRKQGRNEGRNILEIVINSVTYRVEKISIESGSEPGDGTILLFTDVTRDKEYDRLKSDFTSMISHELRTPLTSVRAAVDNFLRGNLGAITQKQKRFLNLIARNVDRQNRLIDDLLDLAKFEAGQMTLKKENSNLTSLVTNAVEQYSLAFSDKQVGISMLKGATIKNIHAYMDGRLMVQAIENLLSNALKFTPEGGNVEVHVRTSENNATLQIVVRDTGIGIEKDKIEKIFDKYTQAESGTRRRFSGTGLGLAIVKEVAHAHGGDVTVKSAPSQGAEFTITIPVENQDG